MSTSVRWWQRAAFFVGLAVGFVVVYRVAKLRAFFVGDQDDTCPGVADSCLAWRNE